VHGTRDLTAAVPCEKDVLANGLEGAVAWDDENRTSHTKGQFFGKEAEIMARATNIDPLSNDGEIGISGVELHRRHDLALLYPPLPLDAPAARPFVESLLCLSRELLELATLIVQEGRGKLEGDVAGQPGPFHDVEAREVCPVF
jgi:hypothetical protein